MDVIDFVWDSGIMGLTDVKRCEVPDWRPSEGCGKVLFVAEMEKNRGLKPLVTH
jgi:hypothetical protein